MSETIAESPARPAPEAPTSPSSPRPGLGAGWIFVLGAALPALTLGVELTRHLSADLYVDPIPTVWHVALVGLVPLANLVASWVGVLRGAALVGARVLNGAALVSAGLYAVVFLPILPLAVPGVFMGIGVLPLTPLLSLIASAAAHGRLARRARALGQRPSVLAPLLGVLLALALPAIHAAPMFVTRTALAAAHHPDPELAATGRESLRRVGSTAALRELCESSPQSLDLTRLLFPGPSSERAFRARESYYRLTGRPWYVDPRPSLSTFVHRRDRVTWDLDQGSERVGTRIEGLGLAASRLDGRIDARASTAYWEWILEFENESVPRREARMLMALPPGGVVSRLTLWVDGEEREAAFAGRGETRAAYEAIVRQRLDPVLVTDAGPGRVLVQCFPVPVQAEIEQGAAEPMRIRVGITAPLLPLGDDVARAGFPLIVERNFDLGPVEHEVWIESNADARRLPSGLVATAAGPGEVALRGRLEADRLGASIEALHLEWAPAASAVVVPPLDGGDFVAQAWRRTSDAPVSRLTVVVDGSASVAPFGPAIRDALVAYPSSIPLEVWLAGDRLERLSRGTLGVLADPGRYAGGQDSVPALVAALEAMPLEDPGTLLWIHGPQAVLLEPTAAVVQHFDRRQRTPAFVSLATSVHLGEVALELARSTPLLEAPRIGAFADDLWAQLDRLRGEAFWAVERTLVASGASVPDLAGNGHVARLWARDEVERLAEVDPADAQTLAAAHQLVSSVTGAVVLETAQQFEDAGLEPVAPDSVPTVPEPGEWALILLGAAALVAVAVRERRRRELVA